MLRILNLCLLIGCIAVAAWLEADYAARHWPNDWAGYCADAVLHPQASESADPLPTEPLARYGRHLADLEQRLSRARAVPAHAWAACAAGQQRAYRDVVLWHRLGQAAVAEPRSVDEVQAVRAVERILLPLERVLERERQWLAQGPAEADLALRLQGRHRVPAAAGTPDLAKDKVRALRPGLVSTIAELNSKAALSAQAATTLGHATTAVATGVLLLWLGLAMMRKPAGPLLWITPVLLASALLMVSLTLGAPPLRTVGVRALQSWNDLVWWPLLVALLGLVLAAAAQRDRWLGPRLLRFTSKGGLAARTAVLCALALAVAWGIDEPARRSELWLGLAVLGLALFAARNAAVMVVTNEPTSFGWPLVAAVGCAVIATAMLRHDRGSALLALGMASAWCVMFARSALALGTMATMAGVLVWWSMQIQPVQTLPAEPTAQQEVVKVQTEACAHLMSERERLAACLQISARSDVFRSVAMARAGWAHGDWLGFGLVDLPAYALAAERTGDRLILQLPMDYIAAPWLAAFGKAGLVALGAYTALLFGLGARALATLQIEGRDAMPALVAAVGGFGVLSAALRVLISSGGALSAIPLTGQPPPMLAYGTSAALAFGLYLGLALGSFPRRGAHRRHHSHQGASS